MMINMQLIAQLLKAKEESNREFVNLIHQGDLTFLIKTKKEIGLPINMTRVA